MSDPTADKTEHSFVDGLDDDDVDALLDRLAERADQRDLQLPGSGASRRGVLAALLGAGSIGAAASQAAAIGESESYGSSTGVAGTDSEPLSEANIQDAHVQDLVVDNLAEIEKIQTNRSWVNQTGNRSFGGGPFTADNEIVVHVIGECNTDGSSVGIRFDNPEVDLDRDRVVNAQNTDTVQVEAVIPAGADYSVQNISNTASNLDLRRWFEFR